ncbi:hypothetical protein BU25DRAFT_448122 [Macroventuria anomochaeta]|uniref:Uncharacterized protein n=1 Tax=Macroventuria anomochaeta TaxID=301207 RepID=A0ACB6S1P1_9PLEO|nr:uncharacterized protein BU25DRAFT_448122 [Macroventuria anomochaeta]KAF2628155.1 hypothetical protein BU25DRAFT_448122 [Macroventuria anomochaeta]
MSTTMSSSNETPDNLTGTNSDWSGAEANYPAGMTFEGSMFPPGRDKNIWGQQDPLEAVGPPGPSNEENGEEFWRESNRGKHVWTGEAIVYTNRRPDATQQEYQTKFWEKYDAQKAQEAEGSVQEQTQGQQQVDEQHFPDALPTPSFPACVPAPTNNNASQQSIIPAPHILQASPPGSAGVLDYLRANGLLQAQQVPAARPSSDIDGEYEVDDEYLTDAPHDLPSPSDNHDQLPDSTPPKTSPPRSIDDWDDDNLLSFWKWKVIRKKGYEPMLTHFPGQTTETLHETWKAHKARCEELGAAWRAAGKPAGSVEEWSDE